MSQERKSEPDRALEEIRREVIESRNLVIKTDNLLKGLHAELKLLGKRQEDFEKRAWLSSSMAYVIFAAMSIGAAMMIASARNAGAVADRTRLERQSAEMDAELQKAKELQTERAKSAAAALEIHRQLGQAQGEQRLRALDAYRQLDASSLSELERQALLERATTVEAEFRSASFERGKAAFRKNDYMTTVQEMERVLAMNPPPEESADASFFAGASLSQIRRPQEAINHLAKFVREDKKSKTRDYAMLLLAQSYEQTQQYDKAADVAREALSTYPNSEFASQLRGRLASAKRGGVEPAAATTRPVATPAAPAPAPTPPVAPAPAPESAAVPAPASPPVANSPSGP